MDKESILRAAIAQLQNDSGSVDLMKKILSQFGNEEKSEVLHHLESIIDEDSLLSNKVNEARADRDRLAKVNCDQKDQLEKLQARNREFARQLKELEEEKENLMNRKSDEEGSERKDSAEKPEHAEHEEVETELQQQDQQEQPDIVSTEDEKAVQSAVSAQESDKRPKKYGGHFKKQYEDATRQSMTSSKE